MAPLAPELRRDLERAVVRARETAEEGARASIAVLGVEAVAAPGALVPTDRDLRTALRARARSLGGGEIQAGIDGLSEEIAYEQWHRMLFARFLAENELLLHPGGAAVSMADVAALAAEGGQPDPWVVAALYAASMLPGIFRAEDPAHQVRLAAEHRTRLEAILAELPAELFRADDAIGWVYQFWQAKRKNEVNESGRKIGGADLPPVTQLFTEHYMVRFLLENSLGAWWAGRHPRSPLLAEFGYLRYREDGTPAAGTFEDWPARAAEVTVMDPCCGSGHFLVAAADMLRKMRAEEEGLNPAQAAAAVIADNLFGLELDARCLQLAAFNLALDAWKAGGHQPLPVPNLACAGIAIRGQRADWHRLAGDDDRMRDALDRLYDLFQDAPELGSLIDPRAAAGEGLWAVDSDELLARLDRALMRETVSDPAAAVFGSAAAGTARAAQLLSGSYSLVATNPPFLTVNAYEGKLRPFLARWYPDSRRDLATVFLERLPRMSTRGHVAMVTPSTWFFLLTFRSLRRRVLEDWTFQLIAELGDGAFGAISGAVLRVSLVVITASRPRPGSSFGYLDATMLEGTQPKDSAIIHRPLTWVTQDGQLQNREVRITFEAPSVLPSLDAFVDDHGGIGTFDVPRFNFRFWELDEVAHGWEFLQTSPSGDSLFDGFHGALRWEEGKGSLWDSMQERARAGYTSGKWRAGTAAWGKSGIAIWSMGRISAHPYLGSPFDENLTVLVPRDDRQLAALMSFALDGTFEAEVRKLNSKLHVTSRTYRSIPFDLEHWTRVAADKYPDGLPRPHSDNPTQWLFKGLIPGSDGPLHVAVARLLGYRWPDQEPDALDELVDVDGVVPLMSVGGERPAAERLRALLATAYGHAWSPGLLDRLLAEAGSPGATLEAWLRDDFFAQHAKMFAQRPFIWHVSDGRADGFSALLSYHRLDGPTLERLTYTYLNDWIERQRARREEPAAEARLVAALGLQAKLRQILDGEPPFDIYVRWKSLAQQAIGWKPDLNDGIRLNIRPFVLAGTLRAKFTIHWNNDRGTDPSGSERVNDLHFSRAEKLAARERIS